MAHHCSAYCRPGIWHAELIYSRHPTPRTAWPAVRDAAAAWLRMGKWPMALRPASEAPPGSPATPYAYIVLYIPAAD
jgi:hypothetical protein